jgi:hypothetical protein
MIMYRIKNWEKFQHFKDRNPPWIKLYRDLLEDLEWFELPSDAAKALILFWLIASESNGELPPVKSLAFRMRCSESDIKRYISKLSHWVISDDINMISPRYQPDILEREGEKEIETKTDSDYSFEDFWKTYRKSSDKSKCMLKFAKLTVKEKQLIAEKLPLYIASTPNTQYRKNPLTWLNGKCWNDEITIGESNNGNRTSTGNRHNAKHITPISDDIGLREIPV